MARKPRPPTSTDVDSIAAELAHAGDRAAIADLTDRWPEVLAGLTLPAEFEPYRGRIEFMRGEKKNFAQRFSNALAQKIADAMRSRYRTVLPDALGRGQESNTRGAAGPKRLDVNYSLTDSGLHLAVSLKTCNFSDRRSRRYTKNVKRADGELRAEAEDCHSRQPFAVLAALVFFPHDASMDGARGKPSSIKHACDVFRRRGGRKAKSDDASRFEVIFVGVYSDDGRVRFIDPVATVAVPDKGLPNDTLSFKEVLSAVDDAYRSRNAL